MTNTDQIPQVKLKSYVWIQPKGKFVCLQTYVSVMFQYMVLKTFVMTYLITVASYWLKFDFKCICSLRPLFKKRGDKGAYIKNKYITYEWLKSVFKSAINNT